MSKCKCGCNEEAKEGNMYLKGHYQKMKRKSNKPKEVLDTTVKLIESPLLDILDMSKNNIDNISKNKLVINYLFMKELITELREIKTLLKPKRPV